METHAPTDDRQSPSPEAPTALLARADLWTGALCVAFGAGLLWIGADYALGTGGRIGPGYAPRLLGWLLIGLGAVLGLRSLRVTDPVEVTFRLRPVVLVLVAVLAFAIAYDRLGLVPAVLVAVAISNWAAPANGWQSVVGIGLILAVFSWLLFIVALKLPMPVVRL